MSQDASPRTSDDDVGHWSSSMSRTASLPNLHPGDKNSLRPFVPGQHHLHSASPCPSEPGMTAGPPKPPRDPMRMSGIFARKINTSKNEESKPVVGGSRRVKRRDSHLRRHTLQGGVDISMVRTIFNIFFLQKIDFPFCFIR